LKLKLKKYQGNSKLKGFFDPSSHLPNTKPVGVIPKERKVLFLSAQFHRESGDETERKI
jgi:hypothetical protein